MEIEIDPELVGEYLAAELGQDAAERRFTAARSLVLNAMGTAKNAVLADDEHRQRFAYRTARTTKDGEPGVPFLMTDKRMKKIMTDAKDPAMRAPAPTWTATYASDRRAHCHRCKHCHKIMKPGDDALMVRVSARQTLALHAACAAKPWVPSGSQTGADIFRTWGNAYLQGCGYRV